MRKQIKLKKQIGSVCHQQHEAAESVAKLYRILRKDETFGQNLTDYFDKPVILSQGYSDFIYGQITRNASDLCRLTKKKMLVIRDAREAGIPSNQIQY